MRENLGEQMGAIVKSGVIERIWRIGEEEPPPLSKEFSEVFPEGVK
jgi:hypothetical protein